MRLEPFGTFRAPLNPVEFVGATPRGRRLVGPIHGARLEGPHLRADQRGTSAADWLLSGPDGTTLIDVRISLRCDDGAFVHVTYTGRADWAQGVGAGPVFSAFRFDTEDERYTWLQSRLVVGKGQVHLDHGLYELFLLFLMHAERNPMIKLMFCLRRHPSLTREEFLAHWRGPHAALGVAGAEALGARRYVQNHTVEHALNDDLQASRQAPPPFDGVVELWFDSTDAVATTFTDADARAAVRALIKDEPAFIDLANSPIFLTEEHEIWDSMS